MDIIFSDDEDPNEIFISIPSSLSSAIKGTLPEAIISKYKADKLRLMCKMRGYRTTGNKQDL